MSEPKKIKLSQAFIDLNVHKNSTISKKISYELLKITLIKTSLCVAIAGYFLLGYIYSITFGSLLDINQTLVSYTLSSFIYIAGAILAGLAYTTLVHRLIDIKFGNYYDYHNVKKIFNGQPEALKANKLIKKIMGLECNLYKLPIDTPLTPEEIKKEAVFRNIYFYLTPYVHHHPFLKFFFPRLDKIYIFESEITKLHDIKKIATPPNYTQKFKELIHLEEKSLQVTYDTLIEMNDIYEHEKKDIFFALALFEYLKNKKGRTPDSKTGGMYPHLKDIVDREGFKKHDKLSMEERINKFYQENIIPKSFDHSKLDISSLSFNNKETWRSSFLIKALHGTYRQREYFVKFYNALDLERKKND